MGIKITWHGHSTYSVEIDDINVVVDPFFEGKNPVCTTSVTEVPADFILQTHAHGDHIGDTVALAKATGAQVISNFEIANWINGHGHDNTWALNTGGGYEFPFGRVKMTPALHSSGLPDGTYGGDPGGYLVFAKDATLYFAGDTALFSDMELIGNAGIDVAIIPTGDNFTMGPDDAFLSLAYLRPKVVIPCHYNTFPPIVQDMHAWAERVNRETAFKAVVLEIEESYVV
jgi:L-ascorbate metabolism protein UlaG (beta-lactamase superfamily)